MTETKYVQEQKIAIELELKYQDLLAFVLDKHM